MSDGIKPTLIDELRTIGCHENGDARCTCGIGMDAADAISALRSENERLTDCLRTVCHELELPQSESGPCDDPKQYEDAILALDVLWRTAEEGQTRHKKARFAAEAERDRLQAERASLRTALKNCLDWMERLRESGDTGFWDWVETDEYTTGRAALTQTDRTGDGR